MLESQFYLNTCKRKPVPVSGSFVSSMLPQLNSKKVKALFRLAYSLDNSDV